MNTTYIIEIVEKVGGKSYFLEELDLDDMLRPNSLKEFPTRDHGQRYLVKNQGALESDKFYLVREAFKV